MLKRRGTLTLRREDGRIVCERVQVADTLGRRLVGLLGRKSLAPDEGMVLRPSFSIHTAFMRFPIDVVFLDHDQTVIRIDPSLKPFSTASCRGAREVVELPAGECARRGLEVGDRVAWAPRGQYEDGPTSENVVGADGQTRGVVVIASSEPRFAKLARFLLEGQNVTVAETVGLRDAVSAAEEPVDAVVVDAGTDLAEGMRIANAVRSYRPEVHVIVAGEAPDRPTFGGIRVYHRWNETEQIVSAVVQALEGRATGAPDTEPLP